MILSCSSQHRIDVVDEEIILLPGVLSNLYSLKKKNEVVPLSCDFVSELYVIKANYGQLLEIHRSLVLRNALI